MATVSPPVNLTMARPHGQARAPMPKTARTVAPPVARYEDTWNDASGATPVNEMTAHNDAANGRGEERTRCRYSAVQRDGTVVGMDAVVSDADFEFVEVVGSRPAGRPRSPAPTSSIGISNSARSSTGSGSTGCAEETASPPSGSGCGNPRRRSPPGASCRSAQRADRARDLCAA